MIELMVAMVLSLMLLAVAFTLMDLLYNIGDIAVSGADVNQNLRGSVNVIARDLTNAGSEIPLGGIPLPGGGTGGTKATAVNMPGPGGRTFNPGAGGFIPVVTPGSGFGPLSDSNRGTTPTDVITIIGVNPISQLDQYPLTAISNTTTSASITVDPRTNIGSGVSQVVKGQLIMLENASVCLLAVTAVNTVTNVITFTHGDLVNDPLGLNQFPNPPNGPNSGTIAQLPPTVGSTTAYHLNMTTYYLDTSSPQRLMKQVGAAGAQPVSVGIDVLQFAFSLSPPGVPDPTRIVGAPNQIRKVNMWLIAKGDHPSRKSGLYYSNSIATSVVVQNLAYYNKY